MDTSGSSLLPEINAVYIKEEPQNDEDVFVKEEPINNDQIKFKEEAQFEDQDIQPCYSQSTSAFSDDKVKKSSSAENDGIQQEGVTVVDENKEQDAHYLGDDRLPIDKRAKNKIGTYVQGNRYATPIANKGRIAKLSRITSAVAKLQKIASNRYSSSGKVLDEYDVFGQHIANQLRILPVRSYIKLQERIQTLITEETLKNLPSHAPITGNKN
ncbi:uncharacterized protein LOC108669816 isoform X6 [Hyalella azteca]|uniref:Uncharacterized protein LOC108669816 isoform X6 n=1 Tax=Hyalella azteca TaxID=294128 RepID=A0A8B7NGG8_HYAAZ|nr:uncharacterized protein LOC108669816 isoform X6 [Hyalella azteca]